MAAGSPENTPKTSLVMDNYGNSAREYIRARTAATSAAFFLPHLNPGMSLLDCGCGEGTITADLAQIAAPGQVIGIDTAPGALDRARRLATERGLTNTSFEESSVYELPFPDATFDAVFSHALFEHLLDKPKALAEIRRVLKPGALVALRSPDHGAWIIEPRDRDIDHYYRLMRQIREALGGDNDAGRHLPGLLHGGGFARVTVTASFESYGTSESVRWYADIHSRFALDSPYAKEWLERGWLDPETQQRLSAAWRTWAAQPNAFAAYAWCEALAWKA